MIRILNEEEILLINSGEIINNIYTIVKELLENSIDAQSTIIEIKLDKSSIIIKDNGTGMSYDDVLVCKKCYSTSKFKSIDNIECLGFRGKALFFIDQISQMTIFTKPENQTLGYKFYNDVIEPYTMNKGTTIFVKNPFYNRPHEKSFIKPLSQEKQNIIELIEGYSVIYSNKIEFKLFINHKYIALNNSVPVGNTIIKFDYIYENKYYINCEIVLNEQKYQTIIHVNNRLLINNKKFYQSIKNIVELYFGKKLFFLYIGITCAPNDINCNIDSNKTTVNFKNFQIWDNIIETIQNNIKCKKHKLITPNNLDLKFKENNIQFLYIKNNKYIFLVCDNDLICIDQHAAHERILAEELKNQPINKQLLITPIIIQKNNLNINLNKLNELFDFSEINGKLIVFAIPSIMNESDVIYFLNNWTREDPMTFLLHHIHEYGCKHSIKAGDPISPYEAIKLYEKLLITDNGSICNHGRPTFFSINEKFLDKLFFRK